MKEIAIEMMPDETRMVVIENKRLSNVMYERNDDEHIVNRIYKGVIRNILPGMSAAFLDIGLGRNAYLKLRKPIKEYYGKRLFVGQSMMVQVVKEEMDGKAARVTTDISFAGRFMVLLPYSKGIKISKNITDDEKRAELAEMVRPYADETCGFIIRTAAAKATKEELVQDLEYLYQTHKQVERRYSLAKVGSEIYRDADFLLRLVRDHMTKDVAVITVDNKNVENRLNELLADTLTKPEIVLYKGDKPLFEYLGVDEELDGIANSTVPLPSGGDLIIDHTEALTVIDVNSKSYIGKTNDIGETALAVNREAAKEACRQIRLRDIGGIIIIDFIDMPKEKQREELLQILRDECRKDRVKTVICGFTHLGLVEMTRKRERQGIQDMLTDTCSACGGSGYLLSAKTVYLQIVRKLIHLHRANHIKNELLIEVHPEVARYFTRQVCKDLSSMICKNIEVRESEIGNNREAYSILSL